MKKYNYFTNLVLSKVYVDTGIRTYDKFIKNPSGKWWKDTLTPGAIYNSTGHIRIPYCLFVLLNGEKAGKLE